MDKKLSLPELSYSKTFIEVPITVVNLSEGKKY